MSVFVAARFSSGISACSSRHTQWASYCNVVEFKDIKCEQATPMWVYVRHDRSEVGWNVKDDESDPETVRHLHANFGIDFDKMQRWRGNHELRAIRMGDNIPRSLECAPDGGQIAGRELTKATGLSEDESYGQQSHLQRRVQTADRPGLHGRRDASYSRPPTRHLAQPGPILGAEV
jgi:hypothetical protein